MGDYENAISDARIAIMLMPSYPKVCYRTVTFMELKSNLLLIIFIRSFDIKPSLHVGNLLKI